MKKLFKMIGVCSPSFLLLCSAMMGLTSCGGQSDDHIVMTYMYGGNISKDLDLVEKAVSDYVEEKIGVTVEFYPISVYEQGVYTRVIGVDEIDLMTVAFNDPIQFYEMDMIKEISWDDISKYAPEIVTKNVDYDMMVRNADSKIIGISTREEAVASGGSYVLRKSDLTACNLYGDSEGKYKDGDLINFDDLRTIFGALKTKFPQNYPIGTLMDESSYTFAHDGLGSGNTKASGVIDLTDINSTTVMNYYETNGYKNYISFMRECRNNGWIAADAETTTSTKTADFKSGKARGVFLDCLPGLRDSYTTEAKEECVQLQIVDPYYVPLRTNGITWSICGTSKKTEAVLKFMNLMWSDQTLMNMVQWGIEGTHYNVIDRENCIIDFANGYKSDTTPYYNGYGGYGDKRYIYEYRNEITYPDINDQIAARQQQRNFAESAHARASKASNFIYDSSKFTAQIKNIEQAISQYNKGLALGSSGDAEYNAMIQRMKANGIDEIIADKQKQLNDYLAKLN